MTQTRRLFVLLVLAAAAAGAYTYLRTPPAALVLTGVVTTNDVIVSPQIAGQIGELRADTAYYTHNVAGLSSQVRESEAALRFQERQTVDQIRQAESTLASAEAQESAAEADLENARLSFERTQKMSSQGIAPLEQFDQARTAYDGAKARVASLKKQVEAQRSA